MHSQSKVTLLDIIKLQMSERNLHISCFNVLIKDIKTQMTLQKVALWDFNKVLWVLFLFIAIKFIYFFFFFFFFFFWTEKSPI